MALIAELFEPRRNFGIDPYEIFLEIYHVRFQVGLVFVRADESKRILARGQNVGPAIIIFLQYLYDHRGTARLCETHATGLDNSEWGLRVNAVARHLTVARLENVKRDSLAREKHDVQRK